MKTKTELSTYIKTRFKKIKNLNELIFLLNFINRQVFSDNQKFSLEYISELIKHGTDSQYKTFSIPKKSGGERVIFSPEEELKKIQQCLNVLFQSVYNVHPAAMGFVPGRSIVSNANIHIRKSFVFNLDLKDFFFSIDQRRIWGRLQYPPFNLNDANYKSELAAVIAKLCCTKIEVERPSGNGWQKVVKEVLPQGAPTSPFLSNIICQKLDFRLNALALRFGMKYSRYADDITFSSNENVFNKNSAFIPELYKVIEEQNFFINNKKIRLQNKHSKQSVTGIIVNKKANLPKKYSKKIRMFLYYWETYGYDKANFIYNNYIVKDNYHIQYSLKNYLEGKLLFLKMVKGETDSCYSKLKTRYDLLSRKQHLSISN